MTGDIPIAYDYYLDDMLEEAANTPIPKHPETIDREVQQLRGIVRELTGMLARANVRWSRHDLNKLLCINDTLKGE